MHLSLAAKQPFLLIDIFLGSIARRDQRVQDAASELLRVRPI
jgi:hypothetical protein